MAKMMIFIDGTWLYSNMSRLAEFYGKPDFHVDFGKLPRVLADEVKAQLGETDVDVVRTYLFGSYARNHDPRDEDAVQRRLEFFSLLKEEYHYEVEIFPVNFQGRRIRRSDRDPIDIFEPKEKCVDIALASAMLSLAAIPFAYDIAVAVLGDEDFKPVLQHVRRLGKRVAIASIKGSCSPELSDPRDVARVKDFDVIWLSDHLQKLELKYDPHQLSCESPIHKGDRKVWTTFHPRKGQRFYCDQCRVEFAKQKAEAQKEFFGEQPDETGESAEIAPTAPAAEMAGRILRILRDRGYGFIRTPAGKDYFFHFTDLRPPLQLQDVEEGMEVVFSEKTQPQMGKAGGARDVRRPETVNGNGPSPGNGA